MRVTKLTKTEVRKQRRIMRRRYIKINGQRVSRSDYKRYCQEGTLEVNA